MSNLDVLVLLVVAYGCSDAFLFGSGKFHVEMSAAHFELIKTRFECM